MINIRQTVRDMAGAVGLAIIALAAGILVNHLNQNPLALAYKSPEQRLQAQLDQLMTAPPFASFPVDTIGLDEFHRVVEDSSALILDARSAVYYRQGHVPGALNLSRDQFAKDYLALRATLGKDKDHPIVVYCSGGTCHDSKMVAQALTTLGFSHVRIFAGGWDAWTAAKLPAVNG
jgi:rhodanese-related sulfurtransferase